MTASLDLTASRNVAWAPIIDISYPGDELPLAGAAIAMQIRLYPGAPGFPLKGIGFLYYSIPPAAEGGKWVLRLEGEISAADLAAFPTGLNKPEPGEADVYAHDIIITYDDSKQDKLALGRFILEPGVTVA